MKILRDGNRHLRNRRRRRRHHHFLHPLLSYLGCLARVTCSKDSVNLLLFHIWFCHSINNLLHYPYAVLIVQAYITTGPRSILTSRVSQLRLHGFFFFFRSFPHCLWEAPEDIFDVFMTSSVNQVFNSPPLSRCCTGWRRELSALQLTFSGLHKQASAHIIA